MRLERDFFPGPLGESLSLVDQLLAPLPAAPALPVAQTQLLLAEGLDAPDELGIHRAGLERAVHRRHHARQLRHVSGGVRRFRRLDMTLYEAQVPFLLLGA